MSIAQNAAQKIAFAFAVTVTLVANQASAQSPGGSASSGRRLATHGVFHGYAHHHSNYGGYGHRGYRHGYRGYVLPGSGSDWAAAAHGASDLIRSRAQANLTNAAARSQNEVARTQRLENDVFALETRLQRQHINKTSRFGHLHARGAEMAEMKLASQSHPGFEDAAKRLQVNELDPQTGRLAWPLLLAMSHFENLRRPVDDVFAARADAGSLHPDDYLPLLDLIDQVMAEVEVNAPIFPKRDFADAQDFLRRMKVEARMPAIPAASDMQLASRGN
tara:strand:+ start:43102 stop:43929 length:828 start_codon:yes stop_codon:yes gene_type:complete